MLQLTKNKTRLLKLFFTQSERAFYMQELGRLLRKKPGVFQKTLNNLEKEGVLTSEYRANARFFKVNKSYPIYNELKSIISKQSALILFLICFFAQIAFCAENASESLVFTSLTDAVRVAYKNNKDIQIQEKEVEAARADIIGARSAFLPDVNAQASYTRRAAVPTATSALSSSKDYGVFAGYKNDNQVGVNATQTIYSGGANISSLRQKQLTFKSQEEGLRAKKLDVEFETKRLYYGLLFAYENQRIAQQLLGQAKAHFLEVKNRYERGTSSRFDLLQSKVQVSLLMPQLIQADNAVDLIKAELKKLLAFKQSADLRIEDRLRHIPIEIKESEFLKVAYLNKPEMIVKSLGIDISKWGIKYARSGWLPQVEGSADFSYRSGNLANIFNNRHNNWDVGVAVTVPIFDGFLTKSRVDAAKARYSQALISKDNVSDQVAVDVKQAVLNMKEAQTVIDSQKDNIAEAKEALKISEVRYISGVGINLDVLDSEVALAQVEQNLASGTYDYIMARASLERSMGTQVLKENKNENKAKN
ncbi:MAG: TolC family protein [Candidatus Omnitrophica bacterium]|nr:TolC family protein [Candidatus Omnitrophota bacterium]